jgi:hypothetical protein
MYVPSDPQGFGGKPDRWPSWLRFGPILINSFAQECTGVYVVLPQP